MSLSDPLDGPVDDKPKRHRLRTFAGVAALLLAAALLSPVSPFLLVGIPLAIMLIAFRPGGFVGVVVAVLLLWMSFTPLGETTPLWYGERAWALLVGGAFVVATLVWPRLRVSVRSILAVGVAFITIGAYGAVRPGAVAQLDWWMASELRWTSQLVHQLLGTGTGSTDLRGSLDGAVMRVLELQIALYPSLLALGTVAALGVAWYVMKRFGGFGATIGPLRDFGFSDHLIWVLIVGLLLFLLPIGDLAARVGQNALAFMGGLYVVRGAAVLAWLAPALAAPTWTAVLWVVIALLFYPVMLGTALLLGISDTWLDIRARWRRPAKDTTGRTG